MPNEITLTTPETRSTTVTTYRIARVTVMPPEQRLEIIVEKLNADGDVVDGDCCKCTNVDQATLDTFTNLAVTVAQGMGKIPPSV